jgi:hypothetical protein
MVVVVVKEVIAKRKKNYNPLDRLLPFLPYLVNLQRKGSPVGFRKVPLPALSSRPRNVC